MLTLNDNDIELIKQRLISQKDITRLANTTSLLLLIEPEVTIIMLVDDLRPIADSITFIRKGYDYIRFRMSKDLIVPQNKIIKELALENKITKDLDFDNTFYILGGNLIEISD